MSNRASRLKAREQGKRLILDHLLEHSCVDCGEDDIEVLTFDHVKGKKKMNISDMVQQGYSLKVKKEPEKTDVTCFNCHMKREQKRRGASRFEKIQDR